ncbi:MAG: hypothetical protein IJ766_06855 [Clostridia bacterium]|nr:hypothetical protein [Clostridia bacterium]
MTKKEITIRALKTFVQAFLGVLIPEVVTILNGGFTDVSTAWKAVSPFIAAALAAGISAVWNSVKGYLDNRTE